MINAINNIDEINKFIRNELISQSGLDSKRVLNGVTTHGQDLIDRLNKYCYKSYEPTDSFIVFVLSPSSSENDISQTLEDDSIEIVSTYRIKCYTYGYSSMDLVQTILARFRTIEVRQNLFNNGIYLIDIGEIADGKEFINETMFIRTDFTIKISVRKIINKVNTDKDITSFDLKVEEECKLN